MCELPCTRCPQFALVHPIADGETFELTSFEQSVPSKHLAWCPLEHPVRANPPRPGRLALSQAGGAFSDAVHSLTPHVAHRTPTSDSHPSPTAATRIPKDDVLRLTQLARDEATRSCLGSKRPVAPRRLPSYPNSIDISAIGLAFRVTLRRFHSRPRTFFITGPITGRINEHDESSRN